MARARARRLLPLLTFVTLGMILGESRRRLASSEEEEQHAPVSIWGSGRALPRRHGVLRLVGLVDAFWGSCVPHCGHDLVGD